jgi:aldehyde:ferredoxin oxidoreductase
VSLSDFAVKVEQLSTSILEKWLGGKGLGTWLLYNEVDPAVNPLEGANKLIFTTGPATGTIVPTANRYGVYFKSPLTGIYAESYSAGYFAVALKQAGYDAAIIEGVAPHPVYLWIDGDEVSIRDAKHLWGRDTFETEDLIREELGDKDIRVACIGPAGENLVRFACIENDYYRSAGRCGGGAVMGSKRLKAIAVRGDKQITVYDEDRLKTFVADLLKKMKDDPLIQNYRRYGTLLLTGVINQAGAYPTRYWNGGVFEGYEKIDVYNIKQTIFKRNDTCWRCPIACHQYCEADREPYRGAKCVIDYESVWALGGLCLINNPEAVLKFNELCDRYGIDTISAGNVIAFAMEAYSRGKLKSDFSINFGDENTVLQLLELITKRKGVGSLLAEGVRNASKLLGLEDIAVHVKGLEPPAYDPRALKAVALAYGVGVRGADHMRAVAHAIELSAKFERRTMDLAKVEAVVDSENRIAISECLILCRFTRSIFDWSALAQTFELLTGLRLSVEDLKVKANEIISLARVFSVKTGVSRKDDRLPDRWIKTPLSNGPFQGEVVDQTNYERWLDKYYEMRGWDTEGRPKQIF